MFYRRIERPDGKVYHYVLESKRDKKRGYPVQRLVANLTGLPEAVIAVVRDMLGGVKVEVAGNFPNILRVRTSMYFGGLWVALVFWLRLGVHKLPFLNAKESRNLSAMVVARCVEPLQCRSESRTAEWLRKSAMHMVLGGGRGQWDRDDFYPLLTKLSQNWNEFEKCLWEGRKGVAPRLYLYDITSTYFEGSGGSYGKLGHSRDEKRGNPQVVIALVADQDGIPVSIRILPGNTKDSTTVRTTMEELKSRFGVDKGVAVMDRGMRTEANIEAIAREGLDYIIALPHKRARTIILEQDDQVEWTLFDERNLAEWVEDGKRHILCRNPAAAARDRKTMAKIFARAEERLGKLAGMVGKGQIKKKELIIARAVKILTQTKSEKYFQYEAGDGKFSFQRSEDAAYTDIYAGCYVLETTLGDEVGKIEVDCAYRNQREIEEVFKSCKDELEVRPNFHKKDENIFGHIYLTFLAHYVKKTLELKIGQGGLAEKGSTFLSKFRDIIVNEIEIGGSTQNVVTELDEEQRSSLEAAGIGMPAGPITASLRKMIDNMI